MKLKAIVASLTDVPAEFHVLYTERNGQFEMTGVDGMKTQADIDRIQVSLVKERNDHKALKDKVGTLGRPIEEIIPILDKVPELEAAAKGNIDEGKINVGCKVKVLDMEYDEEMDFQLVGSTEANSLQGKISNESPVGKALIGAKQGDVVDVELADGEVMQYKVLKIERNI